MERVPVDEIRAVLLEACPIECDVLGPSVIDEICNGRPASEFENPIGGAYLDVTTVVVLVTALANLTAALLKLRGELNALRGAGADEDAVARRRREGLAHLATTQASVDELRRDAVVKAVFPGLRY